eukprot:CAMPEP_0194282800 /NCGR_PEP_ID=MMETSP0169-20130528/23890_1 /TAXON_ID=218684 /ORGANISM="Corethron pennatum, Strain L29A3" /LENGTH=390 /DNA_ID=CAMNT_0039028229 /DNA_START=99 /DNA_END=1271 /DNA_ORIENTATION=+
MNGNSFKSNLNISKTRDALQELEKKAIATKGVLLPSFPYCQNDSSSPDYNTLVAAQTIMRGQDLIMQTKKEQQMLGLQSMTHNSMFQNLLELRKSPGDCPDFSKQSEKANNKHEEPVSKCSPQIAVNTLQTESHGDCSSVRVAKPEENCESQTIIPKESKNSHNEKSIKISSSLSEVKETPKSSSISLYGPFVESLLSENEETFVNIEGSNKVSALNVIISKLLFMVLRPGFDPSSFEIPIFLGKCDDIGKEIEQSKQLAVKEAVQLAYVEMKSRHDKIIRSLKAQDDITKDAEEADHKQKRANLDKERTDKEFLVLDKMKKEHVVEMNTLKEGQYKHEMKRLREEMKKLRHERNIQEMGISRLKKKHKSNLNALEVARSLMIGYMVPNA